jgi:hypothetical protein
VGLISGLLTLPITGPARAGWWILEQVIGAAEAELYDEDKITAQLRALAAEVDSGRISEEEHALAEAALIERLVEARAHNQATQETP